MSADELSDRSGRRRTWAFLPPFLILGVSLGLLAYRMNATNWYWGAAPARRPGPMLARADRPQTVLLPPTAGEQPVAVRPIDPQDPNLPTEQPAPPEVADPAGERPEAVAHERPKEEDPEESIRREADRARAQREEIARFKDQEADRLDRNPPRPEPLFRGMNPAQAEAMRRRQLAIQRQMDAMMEAQIQQFDEIFRGRRAPGRRQPARPPLPWGGLGQANPSSPAPGFLPMIPPEVQSEMDRMFEDVFRMQPGQGLRRAIPPPANRGPGRRPQQAPQPPQIEPPADEIDPRFFT
ncbi:MAG: hypothetical protein U0800_04725 [Isosphaeraceae bacterium]